MLFDLLVIYMQLYFSPATVKMLSNLKVLVCILLRSHVLSYTVCSLHVCTHVIPLRREKARLLILCFLIPTQVLVIAVLLKIVMRRKFSIIQVRVRWVL
jgi:hypothetical protein